MCALEAERADFVELVALKLVDTGLQFVSPRGRLSRPSPGVALIDGRDLAVGLDAERIERIKPRRLHSLFWQDLAATPLGRPFPPHLRTADLAHAHLKSVWKTDGGNAGEVIVAVPGTFSEDQLALLLGIARHLQIPVRGLVDVAVAAAADRELPTGVVHLDIHLHRAVLTELEHGREIVRTAVRSDPRVGLMGLRDTWARGIARTYVQSTRFDPLHVAATEQELYTQLPDILSVLKDRDSTEVRIASGGRHHAVELDRALIVNAVASAYRTLSSLVNESGRSEEDALLLSHRAAFLPGLVEHLEQHTRASVVVLHQAAAASGALNHAERIRSTDHAIPLITRLPGLDARPPGPVTVPVTPPAGGSRHLPTHLVDNGIAHEIGAEALYLGPDGVGLETADDQPTVTVRRLAGQAVLEAVAGAGVLLNGDPVDGRTALAPGDQLRIGSSDRDILVVTMGA
jgi:hypothetical protein